MEIIWQKIALDVPVDPVVSNLLSLQVDACLHETSLDWSKVRTAALGLVQKRGRLFSLSSNNSLLEFIVEGTPQVKTPKVFFVIFLRSHNVDFIFSIRTSPNNMRVKCINFSL